MTFTKTSAAGFCLGALAGKAALRLARSTGRPAFTLARIIGQLAERELIESALHDPGLDAAYCGKILRSG